MNTETKVKNAIRDIPNFPKEGIIFKDITPILKDPKLCAEIVNCIKEKVKNLKIQGIAGIESRGFLFGVPLAIALNVPFILIRKKGKLPYNTISHKYDLEYGTAEIEMHTDAITPGQNILIHDDLLATGGSASAAAELIKKQGGNIIGFNFLVELAFLNGQNKIQQYSNSISQIIKY